MQDKKPQPKREPPLRIPLTFEQVVEGLLKVKPQKKEKKPKKEQP